MKIQFDEDNISEFKFKAFYFLFKIFSLLLNELFLIKNNSKIKICEKYISKIIS